MSEQPRNIRKTQAAKQSSAQNDAGTQAPKRRRKKSRIPLWLPLVIVLVMIGGTCAYVVNYVNGIMENITPESETTQIAEEIKTDEAYQGDVVGILLCGIDYSGEGVGTADGTNDGLTDMIMYMQFDVANNQVNLFQIPRNTYVGTSITCEDTTGNTYSAWNGQINSIVRSNKDENGVGSMAALADVIANNYKLPIDYYASIDMDALKELITRFGGIEVYIPETIYGEGDSVLEAGYRFLDADSAEFFLRERYSYSDGDLGRLNAQRYFYLGLYNRLMTCSVAEIAKLMPVITYFVSTDCDFTTLVSLGVSFLKLDAADIMICQAPLFTGTENIVLSDGTEQSVMVADADSTAALLNEYFRDYTGEVDVSELNLASWTHNGVSSDPNVQYLGQIATEVDEAIENGAVDDVNK